MSHITKLTKKALQSYENPPVFPRKKDFDLVEAELGRPLTEEEEIDFVVLFDSLQVTE
jgi:hypothetical protein